METNKIKAHFEKIVKALKEYNDLYKYVDSVFEVRRGLEALEQARADLASYQLTHEKLLKDYESLKKESG